MRSHFPTSWDENRVKQILDYYKSQTEEQAIAEDEAAYEATTHTAMSVPVDLVLLVRDIIANHTH